MVLIIKIGMMKKSWLLYFMGLIALCGCSRMITKESEEKEICFQVDILKMQEAEIGSRAGLNVGDKVGLYIVEQEGEELCLPANEDFYLMNSEADGSLSFADGEKHVYPDNPINIYGFYCKGMESVPADLLAVPVSIPNVQETEEALLSSDFLYVKSEERYRGVEKVITLNFCHQFAKMKFHFKTDTPETVDLNKITDFKVVNVIQEGNFNIATGELTLGNAVDDIEARVAEDFEVIVLPQKIEGNRVLFHFLLGGEEKSYTVPNEGMSLEKGKLYKCNILVNRYPGVGDKDVVVSIQVEDWDESEPPIDVVIEDGQNVVVTLTDVSNGVVVDRADLYLSSEHYDREVRNVPVANNKMEFVFPREIEGGTLRLNKAHFHTVTGDEFDYYFKDKELLGDNLDELSLVAPKVGDAWGDGVIFAVGKVTGYDENASSFVTDVKGINAYRGRMVSSKALGKLAWCKSGAKGEKVSVGANDKNSGSANLTALKNFLIDSDKLENYPAFKACVDLGEGWYFPAYNEIKYIVTNKDMLNVKIEEQLGDLISLVELYGSSTEKEGEPTHYIGPDKIGKTVYPYTKMSQAKVRAVRAY